MVHAFADFTPGTGYSPAIAAIVLGACLTLALCIYLDLPVVRLFTREKATKAVNPSPPAAEPIATPRVATPAPASVGSATSPALAKTAPNAMIVIGFVSVSPTAER